MPSISRVAVIGAGPAGAIAVDALAQENKFDLIRGFERREASGGCWIDSDTPSLLTNFDALSSRTADPPVPIPSSLPATTPPLARPRYTESSIYPYLETNVADLAMAFSQEPIPVERSDWSVATHGPDTPFRPWKTMRRYVQGLLERRGYESVFQYSTSVEKVEKAGDEWTVTLRKRVDDSSDYWWTETFDAVVVASGRYAVPYIPKIDGLEEFEAAHPGRVLHSKMYRGRDQFKGKRVVTVGASVSAADIAVDVVRTAQLPVHSVVIGHTANLYFGGEAFDHPDIKQETTIVGVSRDGTVRFSDGTALEKVDNIIFGTGYTWTLPFLPQVAVRNNRIVDLYQHVVWQHDPTLLFVGAVNTGLTFKIFEWQAVYAASLLAGRGTLPPLGEMQKWESDRVEERGDGPKFNLIYPDFEEYFGQLRALAKADGQHGGRELPEFDQEWYRVFMEGHEKRKAMWRRNNEEARKRVEGYEKKTENSKG